MRDRGGFERVFGKAEKEYNFWGCRGGKVNRRKVRGGGMGGVY